MKTRTLKLAGIITMCLVMVMTLVGCNYSKSYAEKINKAYDEGKPYTAEEVEKKMGEPTTDLDIMKMWVKGYTEEELDALTEEELKSKKFKIMTVIFLNEKAVAAIYLSGTMDEIEEDLQEWEKANMDKLAGLFS